MAEAQYRLTETSLRFALTHLANEGDTDAFPEAFEFKIMKSESENLIIRLKNLDLDRYTKQLGLETVGCRVSVFPTHSGDFRRVSQLDPMETLILTAAVHQVGTALEEHRCPIDAHVVFSCRFAPDDVAGTMFDARYNHRSFQQYLEARMAEPAWKYVICAEIGALVDSHRLPHVLARIAATSDHIELNSFSNMLAKMQMRWSRQQQGQFCELQVGCAATRLLSEVLLSDVDYHMLDQRGDVGKLLGEPTPVYCRFADGVRIFCASKRSAAMMLQELAKALHSKHDLSLHGHSTVIHTVDDFRRQVLQPATLDPLSLYYMIDPRQIPAAGIEALQRVKLPLGAVLREQMRMDSRHMDACVVDFLLQWHAYIGDFSIVPEVFQHDALCKLFTCVHGHSALVRQLPPGKLRLSIGAAIKKHLSVSVGIMPLTRAYLLFAMSHAPDDFGLDAAFLQQQYVISSSDVEFSSVLYAAGNSSDSAVSLWTARLRTFYAKMSPWCKRAFRYAAVASHMAEHWYRSLTAPDDSLLDGIIFRVVSKSKLP